MTRDKYSNDNPIRRFDHDQKGRQEVLQTRSGECHHQVHPCNGRHWFISMLQWKIWVRRSSFIFTLESEKVVTWPPHDIFNLSPRHTHCKQNTILLHNSARCRKDHVKSCLPDRTLTPLYRCNVNKILFQIQPMGSVPTIPKISYRGVHVMYVRDVCCKGTSCPRQPSRLQELEESKCVLSV